MSSDSSQSAETMVLVVVTEDQTRERLRALLEADRYRVVEARDSDAALAAFRTETPGSILIDAALEANSGFELCQRIRQDPEGAVVPILFLVAGKDADGLDTAYRAGATDFLTKPVQWQLVPERLRYVVRAHERSQAVQADRDELRQAQELAQLGTWRYAIRQGRVTWSEEMRHALGLPEGFQPTLAGFLELVNPSDRRNLRRSVARTFLHDAKVDVEFRMIPPGGGERIISAHCALHRSGDGKPEFLYGVAQEITERRQLEHQLTRLAHYDALTGLPNRLVFRDRLSKAMLGAQRTRKQVAVAFVDLDRFKNINDTLGHEVGDRVIQAVAERLQDCVRGTDTVARRSGDEFTVLITDMAHPEDSAKVLGKIIDALAWPILVGDHELHVTPSIGVTVYPSDGADADTLLKNADMAMYRAKDLGGNRYHYYTADMNVRALERSSVERSLNRAFEREEFRLHYQPQVVLGTGEIHSAEALLRWTHPDLGHVSPAAFVRLLEDTGLIMPVGEWVLMHTCQQIQAWHAAGLVTPRAAINLSGRQFNDPGFIRSVKRVLDQTGFQADRLCFEINESIVMQDVPAARTTMSQLGEIGVQFTVDDYGTGYSSLADLKHLPIRTLKIDRSFVCTMTRNGDHMGIVRAAIDLARNLGLRVMAEGVEEEQAYAMLAGLRCDLAQGYYICKPLDAERFSTHLREPMLANLPRYGVGGA
jgi:diguanylate cyclase (GGDEF)-like protein